MDALSGSYLEKTLPLEAIRALAGFVPPQKGTLYWPRNSLTPPESLQKKIFSWIENGERQIKELIEEKIEKTEFSGIGFLKLLKYLRVVILQDAVVYLNHPMYSKLALWNNPIFKSEEFLLFKSNLEVFLEEQNVPRNIQLERVMYFVYLNKRLWTNYELRFYPS